MVDSHVEVMSFSVVEEIITPFSTKIAELVEIFSTVAVTVPLEVEKAVSYHI